ncbi:MAG: hypothetical protein JNG90_20000 [Planctomycetaceae bacterium]|nr:hypothetical protein [Planctomycetaceae bacterium]
MPGETATGGTPRDSKNSRTGPATSLPPSEATVAGTAPGTSGSEASAGKAPPTLPGVVESGGRESGLPVFDLARDREPLFPGFDDGDDALPPLFDPLGSTYDATSDTRDGVSEPEQPPAPATGGPGLRIVDPTQVGTYIYPTLRAACAAAQDGDVIELRYDGPRAERPFESRNRRLTIRAAENFSPLVRFCPTEDDPLKHPRHMMTVAAGRLTLVNLALELDLSLARPAEGWALFDIQQAELVRLEHCALSIRNTSESGGAQHADVSFFNVDAPPGASTMVMMEDTAPALPTALELRDSIARGEAVFLRVHDLQPVSLNWQNGFLATGQRLLVAAGGAKQPQHLGQLQLELRHLTMAARDGLCLLTNAADSPYQLITQIRCTDSIVVAGPEGSLIEQVGIDSVTDFRARLKWESERDFYDGFSIFWKIRGKSAATTVEEMTLTPWNAFWGGRERSWGRVVWREPPDLTRPPHLQTVADFELDQRVADNPARRGASDGRDAGCEAALLPLFPETRFESDLRSGERGGAAREQGTAARTPELR